MSVLKKGHRHVVRGKKKVNLLIFKLLEYGKKYNKYRKEHSTGSK